MESKTALVLGATGGIGGEVARQLRDAGWSVRALRRGGQRAMELRDGMDWIQGDAMNRDDVLAAARGCSVIVHAVNPPGYRRWAELVLPMIDNTIAAARAQGATIVLPGTVYNFGPKALPLLREDSPQEPLTRKGAVRVELEQRLRVASREGCRVIVVRAGDFFGPKLGNSWFSQGLVKPGRPVKTVTLPGACGVGHQWSYLPDVARTMVELLQRRETLEPFAAFHMAGQWDADGTQMAEAISCAVVRRGGTKPALRAFPWWLTALASPFVPTLREMREMCYLWNVPVVMSNAKLLNVLGHEPHTPLEQAVEATLEGMGCLASASPASTSGAVGKAVAAARSTTGMLRKDKLGRALMTIVVLLTMLAFADGFHRMTLATVDRIWAETWRTFGYVVFAGLFALLALRPRNMPAIWELTMAYKLAATLFGLWLGNDLPEVSIGVKLDFLLVVLIGAAWVLCRGWLSWGLRRAPDSIATGLPVCSSATIAKSVAATAIALVVGVGFQTSPAQAQAVNGIDMAAPVIARNEIVIKAPLATIWKIQTDIDEWPQWRPSVSAARFDGVLQAGSIFKWEEGGLKITSTVQELIPLRRIVWTGPAQGIDAVHVWEFTASEHGVKVRTEESWSGDAVRTNAPALQRVLDGALQDWLTRLKSRSEGSVSK